MAFRTLSLNGSTDVSTSSTPSCPACRVTSRPPRAAARRLSGNAVSGRELEHERVLARKMMRHDTLRPVDFVDNLARVRRDLLVGIEDEIRGADERFREVHRIVDDHDPREVIAMT